MGYRPLGYMGVGPRGFLEPFQQPSWGLLNQHPKCPPKPLGHVITQLSCSASLVAPNLPSPR